MSELVEVRAGAYADSVTLMLVSQRVAAGAGVEAALIAMATPLNLDLLTGMGFTAPDCGPNDLVVAIRASDGEALAAALAAVDTGWQPAPSGDGPADQPARTVGAALRRGPATLALISVPGQHAFTEAWDAVQAGCDVMIFSDNVPIDQEIALKDEAAEHGVLVMGPDCGTAVVDGFGVGFANVLTQGRIGIVAASGTGAQQVSCLLDLAGAGVSAVLGVGGRDLSAAVGGRSTLAALHRLDADPGTDRIVVLSKPPDDAVAATIRAEAGRLATPVRFALLGAGQPDLTAATEAVLIDLDRPRPQWPQWGVPHQGTVPGSLRGLFTGGTLCDEAMLIASAALGPVRSNIPLQPEWDLPEDLRAAGHLMIDFGDDALTAGRPHPMIDPSLRMERIAAEANDPACGVLMLDLVLGYGSHADPGPGLAEAIEAARAAAGRVLPVVVALVGTRADPQGLDRQAVVLAEVGAEVFVSNAQAARRAVELLTGEAR
ncbi:MAG: FdrA family protein [Jatrophihabitans sp.]